MSRLWLLVLTFVFDNVLFWLCVLLDSCFLIGTSYYIPYSPPNL